MAKATRKSKLRSLRKSAVSTAYQSGLELVAKKKLPKEKLATPDDIADIDFTPWKRDPSLGEKGLFPPQNDMSGAGVVARMSYALMLMDKTELVAMHGKVDHKHLDAMMGDMMHNAEFLKAIAQMIEQAYLRVLAAAAYKALRTRGKFKGIAKRPTRADI